MTAAVWSSSSAYPTREQAQLNADDLGQIGHCMVVVEPCNQPFLLGHLSLLCMKLLPLKLLPLRQPDRYRRTCADRFTFVPGDGRRW